MAGEGNAWNRPADFHIRFRCHHKHSGTARTISRTEPGFSANLSLDGDTHREILGHRHNFLKHLEDSATAAKFVAFDMPAGFVADLTADLEKISGKGEEQTDDKIEDVGETARIRDLIEEAREVIGSLNTSVRNLFRRDPEILAEWRTASRIHRTGAGCPHPHPRLLRQFLSRRLGSKLAPSLLSSGSPPGWAAE